MSTSRLAGHGGGDGRRSRHHAAGFGLASVGMLGAHGPESSGRARGLTAHSSRLTAHWLRDLRLAGRDSIGEWRLSIDDCRVRSGRSLRLAAAGARSASRRGAKSPSRSGTVQPPVPEAERYSHQFRRTKLDGSPGACGQEHGPPDAAGRGYRGPPGGAYRGRPGRAYRGRPGGQFPGRPGRQYPGRPGGAYRGRPPGRYRGPPGVPYPG